MPGKAWQVLDIEDYLFLGSLTQRLEESFMAVVGTLKPYRLVICDSLRLVRSVLSESEMRCCGPGNRPVDRERELKKARCHHTGGVPRQTSTKSTDSQKTDEIGGEN